LSAKKSESVPAQQFASHLLAQLVANGVDHIFLAPGARSQALAIAAGQLAEAGHVQLHVRLDERSLGFNALGVGLASGYPAVVITTSGTAVANLHPAVLEAKHAGIPMILLTADRPEELRGVGANQTTNQVGIFADAVRSCTDVPAPEASQSDAQLAALAAELVEAALTQAVSESGPVQLNLAFREPLSAVTPNAAKVFDALAAAQLAASNTQAISIITPSDECGPDCSHDHDHSAAGQPDSLIDLALKTVVIAGDAGYLARWYCSGLPLLAEPSSGVRHLPESVPGYLWILREHPQLVDQIQQVLVFGKPTLSRQVQALLKRPNIKVFADPGRHGVFNPAHNAQVLGDDVEFLGDPDPQWLATWKQTGADASAKVADREVSHAITRRALVETVFAGAGKQNPLILGASRLIREADYWAPAKERKVFANRGLAGIDGTVATATGIALTHPGSMVRVLLGDLTLLHDVGSLAIDPLDGDLNIQVIVGNDHGGSIFEGLEVAQILDENNFDRLFRTPQNVQLEPLAKAYGWQYLSVHSVSALKQAMKQTGRVLIDVKLG
jgi:2-succinyl-5-enolpyruvyl-6-hydroxy-3-cyclohexene-1-carboxylate synthase